MSEEKPTFKITDRRLFNTDGTPRDIEREELPETPPIDTTTATSSSSAAATAVTADAAGQATPPSPGSSTAAAPQVAATASSSPSSSQASTAATPPSAGAASAVHEASSSASASSQDEGAAGGDPTAFVNLIMFIASPAAAAMGLTEHPGLPGGEIDLPLAKHCIDLLATLRQKTDGNLTPQEEQIFEGLLAELRMQFVALSSPRPGKPGGGVGVRGFTGSDITGGR